MVNLVPTAVRVPEGSADELRDIFGAIAQKIPELPAAQTGKAEQEAERIKILSHEIFLQLGKKLVQEHGFGCYDLVGPLFQVELHQEFRKRVAELEAQDLKTQDLLDEAQGDLLDEEAPAVEAEPVVAAEVAGDDEVGGRDNAEENDREQRIRAAIYGDKKYSMVMQTANGDARPSYCTKAMVSQRQERQREEYAGPGIKRLALNMENVQREFYRIFSHFALESKAIYPELFLFQDDVELRSKTLAPMNQILMGTMLRFRGDVTRVNDPVRGMLVYPDAPALYNALDILVHKTPNLRKSDCYIVRVDDPNSRPMPFAKSPSSPGGDESLSLDRPDFSEGDTFQQFNTSMMTNRTTGSQYATLSRMQKDKGLVRNPVSGSRSQFAQRGGDPVPTQSQLASTHLSMDSPLDSPGDDGVAPPPGGAAMMDDFGGSGQKQVVAYEPSGGDFKPISVYLCIAVHVCKITLYTEPAYLQFHNGDAKDKMLDLMILAGTMNDEILVGETLELVHRRWPDAVTPAYNGDAAPTVVHQIAANGNAVLLATMFQKYPRFMSSMLVTPDAGGALPFMVAVYHQQLKTAVLLFRALVELVKHHVQEAGGANGEGAKGANGGNMHPVLQTLVAFHMRSVEQGEGGRSLPDSTGKKDKKKSAGREEIVDSSGVLSEMWYCADFVLDKLSQGTFPMIPIEEDEAAHAAKVKNLQELWTLFGALGFGTANNDRLSAAIESELLQLCTFLALIKARDDQKRTALMLACRRKTAIHEGIVKFILERVPDCELNAVDSMGKSAVDYVMESSSTSSAKLLMDYAAKDANGQDVLLRATLENNAHIVQFLLSYQASSQSANETDAAGWAAGQNLWLLRRGAQAQGTFCTCFIPAKCQELKVRYPLIFGRTFPQIKSLVRDPNAGKVLEDYRSLCERLQKEELERSGKNVAIIAIPQNPKGESLGAMTGLDGLDIFMGRIQCWICKKRHTGHESWLGPVALTLKLDGEEGNEQDEDNLLAQADAARKKEEGGSFPFKAKPGEQEGGPPVLRLFMHHACCVGLEEHLKEEAARKNSGSKGSLSLTMGGGRGSIPPPRARALLRDARDFERELANVPGGGGRTWKTSRGLENSGLKAPSYAPAGENLGSLKAGEYSVR
ncbi:unnamed protein product [Amoebophrya sp. A25]|nr:unnamed protein product [Amoebophrya sp. A25]|eukprot:GSA25T00025707001.1